MSTAYIGLGSNLGDRQANIAAALEKLRGIAEVSEVVSSAIISTKAFAEGDQPDYLNGAARVETSLGPEELLDCMMGIEAELGRVRQVRHGARTIDLDLLLYEGRIIETDKLTVPHRQMHLRSFVMVPMAGLAGGVVHPVIGKTMEELAGRLNGGNFAIEAGRAQLISIAGLIGVGKTTLADALGKELDCPVIREAYDTNPYIEQAYAGNESVALDCQLYFLNSRVAQIGDGMLKAGGLAVSDYVFEKDAIFAGRTLGGADLAEYERQYASASRAVVRPAVVIYMTDEPGNVLERIHNRNRSYEQGIRMEELISLSADYDKLFAGYDNCPVIRLDAAGFDCMDKGLVSELAKELGSYVWM